jgi:hypothetical protein
VAFPLRASQATWWSFSPGTKSSLFVPPGLKEKIFIPPRNGCDIRICQKEPKKTEVNIGNSLQFEIHFKDSK